MSTTNTKLKRFGPRLAELRNNRGMSQDYLARMAGLSRNYIGLLECRKRHPSLETCYRIAEAFKTSVGELVEGF